MAKSSLKGFLYALWHGKTIRSKILTFFGSRSKLPYLKIQWRLSTILETSNKSVWSNIFWYVKICIFWKCIQYNIHWDNTQVLKKFPLDKISSTKNTLSFFRELQRSFTFNFQLLYELKCKICHSKTVCQIFHYWFCSVFIKVYCCVTKCMDSLTLKRYNSF